jgi:hypothetical protein
LLFSDALFSSGKNLNIAATVTKKSVKVSANISDTTFEKVKKEERLQNNLTHNLPTLEEYKALKAGRNPYYCVACDKKFSQSSIRYKKFVTKSSFLDFKKYACNLT